MIQKSKTPTAARGKLTDESTDVHEGDTPESIADRLGFRERKPLNAYRAVLPPPASAVDHQELARWFAKLVRILLVGHTREELATLAGISENELKEPQMQRRHAEFEARLSRFAERWEPLTNGVQKVSFEDAVERVSRLAGEGAHARKRGGLTP